MGISIDILRLREFSKSVLNNTSNGELLKKLRKLPMNDGNCSFMLHFVFSPWLDGDENRISW